MNLVVILIIIILVFIALLLDNMIRSNFKSISFKDLPVFSYQAIELPTSGQIGIIYSPPKYKFSHIIVSGTYEINTIIPKRIYEGDSYSLSFNINVLDLKKDHLKNYGPASQKPLLSSLLDKCFLETELQSSTFTIDGEKKQHHEIQIGNLEYHWNCTCPTSGIHSLDFVIRLVTTKDSIELMKMEHKVRVVKFWFLTKRQVFLLKYITATISGVFAIFEALKKLGLINP